MTEQNWTTVVKSSNSALSMDIKGLKNCKDLIMLFVRRTFVAKYKQTVFISLYLFCYFSHSLMAS